mmetsp:Transcript_15961/g.26918  ORF Transcript_15961/g.26918 Transcript_15961/m.26918 type:complete len:94 (-) Transcript_15961:7-288(-)
MGIKEIQVKKEEAEYEIHGLSLELHKLLMKEEEIVNLRQRFLKRKHEDESMIPEDLRDDEEFVELFDYYCNGNKKQYDRALEKEAAFKSIGHI